MVRSIGLTLLIVLLAATLGAGQETPKPMQSPVAQTYLALLADATSSLQRIMPDGQTRRLEAYLDVTRGAILAALRLGRPLELSRLCGEVRELFGPRLLQRRDLAPLTALVEAELAGCTPGVLATRGGTDLIAGFTWLSRRPAPVIQALVSDCWNQPGGVWPPLQDKLYAFLDMLPREFRARVFVIGCDAEVYGQIKRRIPNTYSVFDLAQGLRDLVQILGR